MLAESAIAATASWCPNAAGRSLLVAGTRAGAIDSSFDTASVLVVYNVDVVEPGGGLHAVRTVPVPDRFHALAWGRSEDGGGLGLIAGGLPDGSVALWDAAAVVSGGGDDDKKAQLWARKEHAGPVEAVAFSPSQPHVLATGARGDLLVWDLKDPAAPRMFPLPEKASKQGDISCLAWNGKVAHILATSSYNGVTVVWDLRQRKPAITFSDQTRALSCRSLAWSPTETTRLITAYENDDFPNIQMWDLRNPYAASKFFEGHKRGIWSVSWNAHDPRLVLSAAKDGRVVCWDERSLAPLCDVTSTGESSFYFEAQWSPLLPGTFAASSLDGRLKVFGISDPQSGKPLAPGAAPFDPPSWLSRPHAASFGFGGKLVHVHPDVDGSLSRVTIHRVRCDEEWAARSREVANLVKAQDVGAIIDAKLAVAPAAAASADAGAAVPFWPLMRAYVDGNWNDILALLGADEAQWMKDVDAGLTPASVKAPEAAPTADAAEAEPAVESPAADARSASLFGPTASDEVNFMDLATASPTTSGGASVPIDSDLPDFAGLFGDLRVSAGADGVLAKAVLLGRFAEAAEHCLRTGRVGDALLLAACGGRELLARTQLRALRAHANPFMGVLAVFMGSAWEDLVEHCSVAQWKECLQLLVARVRVADAVRFSGLARQLGDRLSAEARPADAVTCYLCAGDLAKSVDAWSAAEGASASPRASLLDAVCRIFVFRSAQSRLELPASAAERIRQQAEQLVSEGELETALVFLDELARAGYTDDQVKLLVHRAKRASAPTVVAAAPQAAAAAGGRAGPALSASAAQAAPARSTGGGGGSGGGSPYGATPFVPATVSAASYAVPSRAPLFSGQPAAAVAVAASPSGRTEFPSGSGATAAAGAPAAWSPSPAAPVPWAPGASASASAGPAAALSPPPAALAPTSPFPGPAAAAAGGAPAARAAPAVWTPAAGSGVFAGSAPGPVLGGGDSISSGASAQPSPAAHILSASASASASAPAPAAAAAPAPAPLSAEAALVRDQLVALVRASQVRFGQQADELGKAQKVDAVLSAQLFPYLGQVDGASLSALRALCDALQAGDAGAAKAALGRFAQCPMPHSGQVVFSLRQLVRLGGL